MKTKTTGALGALTILLACAACTAKTDYRTPTPSPSASDPNAIRLGLLGSFSGPAQSYGNGMRRGAMLGRDQINALGGIGGRTVELVILDDGSASAGARRGLDFLLNDGIRAAIGPTTSTQLLELAPRIRDNGFVFVTPTASDASLDALAGNVFRMRVSDGLAASAAVAFMTEAGPGGSSRCVTPMLVTREEPTFAATASAIRKRFEALARPRPASADVGSGASNDYAAAAKKVLAALASGEASCQVVLLDDDDAGSYAREFVFEAKSAGVDATKVTTLLVRNGTFAPGMLVYGRVRPSDPASPNAFESWYVVAPDLTPPTLQLATFRASWDLLYPDAEPDGAATAGYDAVMLLAAAASPKGISPAEIPARLVSLSKGGVKRGPGDLVDYLRDVARDQDVDYEGVSGPVDFGEEGAVTNPMLVLQIGVGDAVLRVKEYPASDLGDGP